ncbi:MAG: hypothetical protein AB1427_08700 [Thermodesulfobacteriota bacterium]
MALFETYFKNLPEPQNTIAEELFKKYNLKYYHPTDDLFLAIIKEDNPLFLLFVIDEMTSLAETARQRLTHLMNLYEIIQYGIGVDVINIKRRRRGYVEVAEYPINLEIYKDKPEHRKFIHIFSQDSVSPKYLYHCSVELNENRRMIQLNLGDKDDYDKFFKIHATVNETTDYEGGTVRESIPPIHFMTLKVKRIKI